MPVCYVGVGSNLGRRREFLEEAIRLLNALPHVHVARTSSFFETRAAGGPAGQPSFLNAAVEIHTGLPPRRLLDRLHAIERLLGRKRNARWEARTIDLDLLLYGTVIAQHPSLQIPHPRMHYRRFVLEPLAQIAPQARHPVMGWTVQRLLQHLLRRPRYLALAGGPGAAKTALARRIATHCDAALVSSAAADPSRQPVHDLVQFTKCFAEPIDRRQWIGRCGWIVSDYWLPEQLLTARKPLTAADQFLSACHTLESQTLTPTLLGWLSATQPHPAALHTTIGTGPSDVPADHVQSELNQIVGNNCPAPLVPVDTDSPEQAFEELVAAMTAAAGEA